MVKKEIYFVKYDYEKGEVGIPISLLKDDQKLIEAIKQCKIEDNAEIFKKEKNVIATSAGIYVACYTDDITPLP